MRIVLINWARIWDGAAHGGGVNGYCQALALELVRRGHEVVSLCSGTRYERGLFRTTRRCHIERHPDWLGVRVYEVVNSPVLAPSLAQFRDPMGEVSAPVLEQRVEALIRRERPDVVHVHNLEGFSAGCVAAIRRGAPTARLFFTLHNYHTICPQVYLMQGHRRPCLSFDNGHACAHCIPTVDPAAERRRLARGAREPAVFTDPRGHTTDSRGQTADILAGRRPHPWTEAGLTVPAWRPLSNDPVPEPPSDKPPNDYARRRQAMIAMLNACDLVLAVSEFVRRKFERLGVSPRLLRTLHIGTRMCEIVARHPEALHPPPPLDPPRPLRLAFVGHANWYKGLPMLLDSLELLVPEVLARIHLLVLASGVETVERPLRRLQPRLAGLTVQPGYDYDDLPWLLGGVDMGIVPSVWWDNAPQTVMEFFACRIPVLGAALGGIVDFIRHGDNGLLFRGNDRWDLARHIAQIVREPELTVRLRGGIRPIKSMTEHAAEMEALYAHGVPCPRSAHPC